MIFRRSYFCYSPGILWVFHANTSFSWSIASGFLDTLLYFQEWSCQDLDGLVLIIPGSWVGLGILLWWALGYFYGGPWDYFYIITMGYFYIITIIPGSWVGLGIRPYHHRSGIDSRFHLNRGDPSKISLMSDERFWSSRRFLFVRILFFLSKW